MPQQIHYDLEKRMVVITYTGAVTIQEAAAATVQALGIQKEQRADRVLIDVTAMTAWPSLSEMYHLVRSYPQLDVPQRTRVAALRPAVPDPTDLSGFYETLCQNRCYNARVFQSREAAEQWLQSDQGSDRTG